MIGLERVTQPFLKKSISPFARTRSVLLRKERPLTLEPIWNMEVFVRVRKESHVALWPLPANSISLVGEPEVFRFRVSC